MPEFVIGLDDAKRDLLDIPRQIVADLFPAALASGGAVLEDELAARTPESAGATSTKEYGPLRDDLDIGIEVDARKLTGSAKVGFSRKAYVAKMVEFGHREVTHAGKQVGSAAAHPFMRPAADAAADRAVEAFEESLGE